MHPSDRALLYPPKRPCALDDLSLHWIENLRALIKRDPLKLRAGFPACIEIYDKDRGWIPLNLVTNGIEFTGCHARNTILRALTA